jgi:hypothetical protein
MTSALASSCVSSCMRSHSLRDSAGAVQVSTFASESTTSVEIYEGEQKWSNSSLRYVQRKVLPDLTQTIVEQQPSLVARAS